jgi:hypothetical protein
MWQHQRRVTGIQVGHRAPFKAGVQGVPNCVLVCTAHEGANAGICRQVREQGCKGRRDAQVRVCTAAEQSTFSRFIMAQTVAMGALH